MTPDEIARQLIEDDLQIAIEYDSDLIFLLSEAIAAGVGSTARRVMMGYYRDVANAVKALAPKLADLTKIVDSTKGKPGLEPLHSRLTAEIEKVSTPFTALSQRLQDVAGKYEAKAQAKAQQKQEAEKQAASAERMRQSGRRIRGRSAGLSLKWQDPYAKQTHKHRANLKIQAARSKKAAQPQSWRDMAKMRAAESIDFDNLYVILERLQQGIPKNTLIEIYGRLADAIKNVLTSGEFASVENMMLKKPEQYERLIPTITKVMEVELKKIATPLIDLQKRLTSAVDKFKGAGSRMKKPGRTAMPSAIEQIARSLQPI